MLSYDMIRDSRVLDFRRCRAERLDDAKAEWFDDTEPEVICTMQCRMIAVIQSSMVDECRP